MWKRKKEKIQFSPEATEKMVSAFLMKYETELGTISGRIKHLSDPSYRAEIARTDPVLSRVVEGHTREEIAVTLERLALAAALVEAVKVAFEEAN
jgi:hypothetical protein